MYVFVKDLIKWTCKLGPKYRFHSYQVTVDKRSLLRLAKIFKWPIGLILAVAWWKEKSLSMGWFSGLALAMTFSWKSPILLSSTQASDFTLTNHPAVQQVCDNT